jgi:hypothetical protein
MIEVKEDKEEETETNNLYWYEYRLRGFSLGCQPRGHVEVNHSVGRFGAIAYDRPLTETEINDYELRSV